MSISSEVKGFVRGIVSTLKKAETTAIEVIRSDLLGLITATLKSNDVVAELGYIKAEFKNVAEELGLARKTTTNYRAAILNAIAQAYHGIDKPDNLIGYSLVSASFTQAENYKAASRWLVSVGIIQGGKSRNHNPPKAPGSIVDSKELERINTALAVLVEEKREMQQRLDQQTKALASQGGLYEKAEKAAKDAAISLLEKGKVVSEIQSKLVEYRNNLLVLSESAKKCKNLAQYKDLANKLIKLAESI